MDAGNNVAVNVQQKGKVRRVGGKVPSLKMWCTAVFLAIASWNWLAEVRLRDYIGM
jgi:hypothetical protein